MLDFHAVPGWLTLAALGALLVLALSTRAHLTFFLLLLALPLAV